MKYFGDQESRVTCLKISSFEKGEKKPSELFHEEQII